MSISFSMWRITFAAALVGAILAISASQELYDDKYDNIEPLGILENDRLREQYFKCFMDTGPCVTADAKFFKMNLPEAIVTKCTKCTEKQKVNFGTMVEWYVEHRPEEWETLVAKFVSDAKAAKILSA